MLIVPNWTQSWRRVRVNGARFFHTTPSFLTAGYPKWWVGKMYFLSNTVWLFWSMMDRYMNFKMVTMLSRVFQICARWCCKKQKPPSVTCQIGCLPTPRIGGGYRLCCFDMISYLGDVWTSKVFHYDSDGLYMPYWFPLVQWSWQPNQICNHSVSTLPYLRWTCILWLIDISISFRLNFDGKIDLSQGP